MKKELINRKRTLSRLMAIQIFYQFEFFKKTQNLQEIKENLIDNYILFEGDEEQSYRNKIDEKFIDDLLDAIEKEVAQIDEDISLLQKKPQEIEEIAKQIIRFAAIELKLYKDVDFQIIISEYVDIAAYFFDETKIAFINSIINNLAKKYR